MSSKESLQWPLLLIGLVLQNCGHVQKLPIHENTILADLIWLELDRTEGNICCRERDRGGWEEDGAGEEVGGSVDGVEEATRCLTVSQKILTISSIGSERKQSISIS